MKRKAPSSGTWFVCTRPRRLKSTRPAPAAAAQAELFGDDDVDDVATCKHAIGAYGVCHECRRPRA